MPYRKQNVVNSSLQLFTARISIPAQVVAGIYCPGLGPSLVAPQEARGPCLSVAGCEGAEHRFGRKPRRSIRVP